MQNENEKTNGQEVKREIPNQHLADRIAGKVDEQGKELAETKTSTPSVESGVPNQHLADKIAGKVDHNNAPIEEALGEVPEELPTHLGGIELENETSTETTTEEVPTTETVTENSTEEVTSTETEKTTDSESTTSDPEEGKVGVQPSVDDGAQKG